MSRTDFFNSLLGYRQWYYDDLRPWENYVPIAEDLSDFDEQIDVILTKPALAAEIAGNAARLAAEIRLAPALDNAVLALGKWLTAIDR